MKPIRWSSHALKELVNREVERKEVELTIAQPDAIQPAQPPRLCYMRRYVDSVRLQSEMLLRVILEETDIERVVVTLYKTSKFGKYEKEDSV